MNDEIKTFLTVTTTKIFTTPLCIEYTIDPITREDPELLHSFIFINVWSYFCCVLYPQQGMIFINML